MRAHGLQHVPVTHAGLDHGDPGAAHRQLEAQVAHHRGHDSVLRELALVAHGQREDRHDLVTVDDVALGIHRQAAVGVSVMGDPHVVAVLDDRLPQVGHVRRAAALVDVVAIGAGVDRQDLGTHATKRARRGTRSRTVAGVDNHAQAGRAGSACTREGARRSRREHRRSARPARRSHRSGAASPRLRRASICSSTSSASLCPPRAKNLIPLSGIGLCEAEIITPRSTPSSAVRWATAGVGRTPRTRTSRPALARPATWPPRGTRHWLADHAPRRHGDGHRAPRVELAELAEDMRRPPQPGPARGRRSGHGWPAPEPHPCRTACPRAYLLRRVLLGDSTRRMRAGWRPRRSAAQGAGPGPLRRRLGEPARANAAVRPEGRSSGIRTLVALVDAQARPPSLSAWSTGEPCGPSSGRTSCAP